MPACPIREQNRQPNRAVGAGPRARPTHEHEGSPVNYDPRIHHRRSIRLRDYDYSKEGAYFVTVCVQDKTCLFGEVSDDEMRPNEAGRMIEAIWAELPRHYPGMDIDAFQLMPNHIHGIIVLFTGEHRPADNGKVGTCRTSLPDVIGCFKSLTTRRYGQGVLEQGWLHVRGKLWQRNYHERVVRNEDELGRIRTYIHDNPLRWALDRENPQGREREGGEAWEA